MVSNYIKSFIKSLVLLSVMISACCESPCCYPEQKSRKKISLPKIRYNQYIFDTSSVVRFRSSSRYIPATILCRDFSLTLTTLALYQRSLRWFAACTCMPAERGLPSSPVQPRGALSERIFHSRQKIDRIDNKQKAISMQIEKNWRC
jgi:hypothetical protein